MTKPYYYWEPIGRDLQYPDKPEYVQLRARSYNEWEYMHWGFFPNGLGDACWRMGLYVATYPEDELAVMSLYYMLDNKLRYLGPRPERSGLSFRRYKHPRWQFTRDQLIAGLFGLAMAKRIDLIKELRIPWFISIHRTTPALRAWIRYLRTGDDKHARRFHLFTLLQYWWANKTNSMPMYGRHLTSLQLFLCPNKDCSRAVMENVNPDNIHLQILNDYDQRRILLCKPDEYVSTKGWAPQSPDYQKGLPPIPEDEAIKLDKDFLIKIATIWEKKMLKENPMNLLQAMFGNGFGKSIRN